jgi:hypothetical protein
MRKPVGGHFLLMIQIKAMIAAMATMARIMEESSILVLTPQHPRSSSVTRLEGL